MGNNIENIALLVGKNNESFAVPLLSYIRYGAVHSKEGKFQKHWRCVDYDTTPPSLIYSTEMTSKKTNHHLMEDDQGHSDVAKSSSIKSDEKVVYTNRPSGLSFSTAHS